MVPALGELVTEATVGQWFKKPGDSVIADEPVLELETDKVTLEVNAPATGVLADIKVPQGTTVAVGSILGSISSSAGAAAEPGAGENRVAPGQGRGVACSRLLAASDQAGAFAGRERGAAVCAARPFGAAGGVDAVFGAAVGSRLGARDAAGACSAQDDGGAGD